MCVLDLYPLCFVLALHHTDFVVRSAALALSKNTDVDLIDEDALDCFVSPLCGIAGFEDGIELHTGRVLIFHRRKDTHLIQSGCDASDRKAVLIHGEDHLDIFADCLIDDELIFVLRGFLVAIGSECTHKLTVLLLDLQAGTDFH